MKKYFAVLISLAFATNLMALPAFKDYPSGSKRHAAFFAYLKPLVKQANADILMQRHRLLALYRKQFHLKQKLTTEQKKWLEQLFLKYRINFENTPKQWNFLINRVDVIPASLALAQAANETAYGITRFAQNANNFYGVWCHTPGCGLVPHQREKDKTHEIKKYPSVAASIADYMLILNTRKSYNLFRELRAQERSLKQYPSGMVLASGLLNYSQRREIYVEAIQKIIIKNQLEKTINYNL